MALSPYKNSDALLNRRSASCSSPVRNRIVYQEIYSLGVNTLVRSYSCDQVFDKDAEGRTFQTTQIQVSSFITPEKKVRVKPVQSEVSEPPKLALEFHGSDPHLTQKKNKSSMKSEEKVLVKVLIRTMIYTLLTVTSAYAIFHFFTDWESSYVWDIEKTENELKNSIFGQDQAIAKINSVLKICNSTKDIHVLMLTGGIGVGKTYASSIISRNFPWRSNKLITYSEYFARDIEKLLKQKLSIVNLIIVDDLPVKAAGEAVSAVTLLSNNWKKNEKVLIILIFQTQTEMDKNEITGNFKDIYFNVYHAPFKPLTQDVIEKCFNAEIQRQKVKIPSAKFKQLVEDKMKYDDIIKGTPGCKGVADEVASFYQNN